MEYTQLADYALPDGTVTTWTPVCDAETWRHDARGISYDHEAHVRTSVPGSWIGSVMRIPMRHDAGTLRRTLRAWISRHEALRTTVQFSDDGSLSRLLLAAPDVDVQSEFRGAMAGSAAHDAISDFFASVTPSTWPHCVFATVIEPDCESFVLAFGADHSVMDAYSQLLWFGEIASLYSRALTGDHDGRMAAFDVGSHVDHSAAARSLGAVVSEQDPSVLLWREYLSTDDGYRFPAYPGKTALGDAGKQQHSLSRWVVEPADADRLEAMCRERKTGTQSGVVAALGRAVRAETGADRLRFVMPMHTRNDRRHADAVGWYVGICPLDIDLTAGEDFSESISRARAAVSAVRGCAKTPFARVAEILGVESEPRFVVSYVDVRQVPGSVGWNEWNARALRSPVVADDEVYLWIVHSENGICVSARCSYSDESLNAVHGLISAFQNEITGAISRADAVGSELGA